MTTLTCARCKHVWIPRTDKPLRCPACHRDWRKEWAKAERAPVAAPRGSV